MDRYSRNCRYCGAVFYHPTARNYCPDHRHISKIKTVLHNIQQRCTDPQNIMYPSYGRRGIRARITLVELVILWNMNRAHLLKQPSIDRINNDGDYEFKNCRWIEWTLNRKLSRQLINAKGQSWAARRYLEKMKRAKSHVDATLTENRGGDEVGRRGKEPT